MTFYIDFLYERLCRMLIPYGIRFAPHLHDKRKEREKKRKERNETKQENFCGGKSSFCE